ncbi:hypothetical protein VIGAN_03238900 [Vigna angularis var. angularis]|uniref:Uncharacterized protein n=1 Tax=Vigna angularis var. angularis TaxID=157739 RepID=A0A0S3RP83_PHAAN|nr:hypothetical protein VIGAN_03238900 [Vigna angularis var. angularis]
MDKSQHSFAQPTELGIVRVVGQNDRMDSGSLEILEIRVGRPDASGEDKEEDDCEGDDNAVEDDQGRRVLDFDLIPAAVAREDVKSSFSNADHHGKRSSGAEAVKQKAPITVLAGVPKENIEDCYLVDRELSVTYLCIDRDTRELLACKSISKRGCSGSSVRLSTSRMFAATRSSAHAAFSFAVAVPVLSARTSGLIAPAEAMASLFSS